MGTYYAIDADVALDARAAAAFETLDSRWWLDDDLGDDLGDVVWHRTAGGARLRIAGLVRNLGRHLEADLALAALAGELSGAVTVRCSDGENFLSHTHYEQRRVLHGTSDCADAHDVALFEAVVSTHHSTFTAGGLFGAGFVVSVLTAVPGPDGRCSPARHATLDTLEPVGCCCAGWDDDADEPRCASRTRPTGHEDPTHQPPAAPTPPGFAAGLDTARLAELRAGHPARPDEPDWAHCLAHPHTASPTLEHRRPLQCWLEAVRGSRVDDELLAAAASRPEVFLALVSRSATSSAAELSGEQLESLADAAWASLGDAPELTALLASHPSLTHPLAERLARAASTPGSPFEVPAQPVLAALAANPATPDLVLATLPGRTVAERAAQRLASSAEGVELVAALGAHWDGDAASLATAALAVLDAHS